MAAYIKPIYVTVKPYLNDFFHDQEKTASLITAISAKYLLETSYSYALLIGCLTFVGIKVYKYEINKETTKHVANLKSSLLYDKKGMDLIINSQDDKQDNKHHVSKVILEKACKYLDIELQVVLNTYEPFPDKDQSKDRIACLAGYSEHYRRMLENNLKISIF